MSLAALALRVITVKALLGRTVAADRVYDSKIETIDELIRRQPAPLLVVSVDDADSRGSTEREPTLSGDDSLTLLLETAVSGPAEVVDDSAGVMISLPMQATSQGLEATLDILWRQAARALSVTTTSAPWGNLWHEFVLKILRIEKRRGGAADKGVRFASRFILISVQPIDDPQFGSPPDGPWATLLAAMAADANLAGLGELIAREIEEPAGLADWRVAQALLGITDAGIRGIGLAPFGASDADAEAIGETAAPLAEVTVDPLGVATDDDDLLPPPEVDSAGALPDGTEIEIGSP
jgi:hypothetical protein